MTLDAWLTIGVIAIALTLFITERVTIDLTALIVLSLLLALGLVAPQEGISGFSNPATITVLCMFILSAAIERTGLVDTLGRRLARLGGSSEVGQLAAMLAFVVPVSAFVNNTAAVAIMLPMAVGLARESGRAPSKLLIPLSFAAITGGLITVIGTSTNLIGSSISYELGYGYLGMFEFAAPGAILAAVAVGYLLLVGRKLLPERGLIATQRYGVHEYLGELIVHEGSPAAGRKLSELDLVGRHGIDVLRRLRPGTPQELGDEEALAPGDALLVTGARQRLHQVAKEEGLVLEEALTKLAGLGDERMSLYEVQVTPDSAFVGHSLDRLRFGWRYGGTVIAVRRRAVILHTRDRITSATLDAGDALLVAGTPEDRARCLKTRNLELLEDLGERKFRRDKVWIALLVFAGVVLLAATGVTDILVSAVVGATLMAVLGVLRMDELHRAIRWDILFLLAGLIPLGIALKNSGLAQVIAGGVQRVGGDLNPLVLLILAHVVTALLTEVMSNNASVVLLAPVAATTAASLGLDPKPFIIVVCFAASMSFLTPYGYQTNALVYGPGGYRFRDYARVGWPLSLTFAFLSPWLVSRFFPLVP